MWEKNLNAQDESPVIGSAPTSFQLRISKKLTHETLKVMGTQTRQWDAERSELPKPLTIEKYFCLLLHTEKQKYEIPYSLEIYSNHDDNLQHKTYLYILDTPHLASTALKNS